MKTISKYLTIFLLIAALLCVCFGFVACGSDDDDKKDDGTVETLPDDDDDTETGSDMPAEEEGEKVTYRFEAEYTDMTYDEFVYGSGQSGTVDDWTSMITINSNASSGYMVAYTWRKGVNIKFTIESSEACVANLHLGLANDDRSEHTIGKNELEVNVNGTAVDYSTSMYFEACMNSAQISVYDFEIGNVELEAGTNVIILTVLENEQYNGGTWGPDFDYMDLRVPAEVELAFADGALNDIAISQNGAAFVV